MSTLLDNRYELIERIGDGGMAEVYRAHDKMLDRFVAVKILHPQFTSDESFVTRFRREAQGAAKLSHPNIVSIYDVGSCDGKYYIVMEYIKGETLKDKINREAPLPIDVTLKIVQEIAEALENAHANHLVHCDIKPHNILINEAGHVKVADFGIARATSSSTITYTGTIVGSVHYFSPEHARGGYTDSKSDLYSLGVVMYEMVTGKVPFDADTPVSIALKHMQEEPVPPIKVNKEIPFAVNQIILKAMKKDPNERYQNASEMIKDLNIALKRPEGGFVEERNFEDSFTRRIPTVNVSDNRNGNIKSDNEEEKPKGKIATFFYNHPKTKVASIIALFVLIFVATLVITLTVINSSSPKDVQIPNVVNLTQEEAKQRIEQLKLKFAYKEEYSADVEAGHVISQDPQYINNYSVKEGSTVTVVISKGMEQTKVPKVIGMEYSKAESALNEAGLEVEKVEETSQKVEAGYVISQEIDANTEVQKGTKIKIHVSTGTGIKKVTVTSVIGKSSEEAKKILTDLKLEVNVVEDEDTSKSDGVVLKQSLDSGKIVDKGSAITITVNSFEASKTISVSIDVKSITGGYTENSSVTNSANSTSNDNVVKTVSIEITSGGKTLWSDSGVDKNTTNKSASITGKGSMDVTLTIKDSNGMNKVRTQTVNFGSDTAISFK